MFLILFSGSPHHHQ